MPEKPALITHVSDTARWVATYRALETESRNPTFRDPYARRLAGERGFAILDALPDGRRWAWPLITRTAVLDEMIQRTISEHQVDTVLNLAAGFDARPWRLPLPSPLNWIDADLPVMLDEKEQVIRAPFFKDWPQTMRTTVELAAEAPDQTRVTVRWEPQDATAADIAEFVKQRGSMTGGWTGSFDKLEALLGQ